MDDLDRVMVYLQGRAKQIRKQRNKCTTDQTRDICLHRELELQRAMGVIQAIILANKGWARAEDEAAETRGDK